MFKVRANKIISQDGRYTISPEDVYEHEGVVYHVVQCSNWDKPEAEECLAGIAASAEEHSENAVKVMGVHLNHNTRCHRQKSLPTSLLLGSSTAHDQANAREALLMEARQSEPELTPVNATSSTSLSARSSSSNAGSLLRPQQAADFCKPAASAASTSASTSTGQSGCGSSFAIGTRFKSYDNFLKRFSQWYNDLYPGSKLSLSVQKNQNVARNKDRYYPRCGDLADCDFRLTLHSIVGKPAVIVQRVSECVLGC